jgi:hypothetical protein
MNDPDEINPVLDQLANGLRKANKLLTLGIAGISDNPAIIRSWYLRGQAQVINDIGSDVCYLVQARRLFNIPALTRVAFEASVKMEAAVKVGDYVPQQYLSEQAEIVREFDKLVKSGASSYKSDLQDQISVLQKLKDDLDGVKERKWKFSETVEAAGLKEESDDQYPMLSQAIHCTVRGMTAFKNQSLAAWCLPSLLRSMIRALEHLVFFKDGGNSEAKPITTNWMPIVGELPALMDTWDKGRHAVTSLMRRQSN